MQIRTDITPDELSQAIQLNRTKRYWPKVFWANLYAPLLLILILWTEIARLIEGEPTSSNGTYRIASCTSDVEL